MAKKITKAEQLKNLKKLVNMFPKGELKNKLKGMYEAISCGFCPTCKEPISTDDIATWPKSSQKVYKDHGFCHDCIIKFHLKD
jgi:hypothetical protein